MNLTTEAIRDVNTSDSFEVVYYGHKLRAKKEDDETVFVLAKGKSRYGYRCYARDGVFREITGYKIKTADDKNIEWRKRLRRAVKALDSSGLWTNIRAIYQELLNSEITLNEKETILQKHWGGKAVEYCRDNGFDFMILNTDVKDIIDTDYIFEISDCNLKSMYFGKYFNKQYKQEIQEALANKKAIRRYAESSYDVTFSYEPESNRAIYSEEYKGCCNGHYYLALDANTAVFYEND